MMKMNGKTLFHLTVLNPLFPAELERVRVRGRKVRVVHNSLREKGKSGFLELQTIDDEYTSEIESNEAVSIVYEEQGNFTGLSMKIVNVHSYKYHLTIQLSLEETICQLNDYGYHCIWTTLHDGEKRSGENLRVVLIQQSNNNERVVHLGLDHLTGFTQKGRKIKLRIQDSLVKGVITDVITLDTQRLILLEPLSLLDDTVNLKFKDQIFLVDYCNEKALYNRHLYQQLLFNEDQKENYLLTLKDSAFNVKTIDEALNIVAQKSAELDNLLIVIENCYKFDLIAKLDINLYEKTITILTYFDFLQKYYQYPLSKKIIDNSIIIYEHKYNNCYHAFQLRYYRNTVISALTSLSKQIEKLQIGEFVIGTNKPLSHKKSGSKIFFINVGGRYIEQ